MSACTATCPSPEQLRGLLGDRLTDVEQTRLVEHLDRCEGCQRALDRMAQGDTPMPLDAVRPPTDSAFWPALAALRDDQSPNNVPTRIAPAASEEASAVTSFSGVQLDFLSPAEKPGTLG